MRAVRKAKTSPKTARRATARGDVQKAKIYAWEDIHKEQSERNTLDLSECQRIVLDACEFYGVKPPRVTVHYDGSMSFSQTADENDAIISLQGFSKKHDSYGYGGLNAMTVLHEVAHHVQSLCYPRTSDHGYRFAGLYMVLLHRFNIPALWSTSLTDQWTKYGIRWAF